MTTATPIQTTADQAPRRSIGDPALLPTFLGIGAQRAGTTWLHECLDEHPQVFVPELKELNFFGQDNGYELADYLAHFGGSETARARGEITPTYMCDAAAVDQIAEFLPNVRLFAVLREPISRAYSAYQLFQAERYGQRPFAEVCTPDSDLVRYGRYAEQLRRIQQRFAPEQWKVFLYDDVVASPLAVLREIFTFIGVDGEFVPTCVQRRYNRIMFPTIQRRLGQLGLTWAVERFKRTAMGDWVRRAHARNGQRADDVMSATDRRRIANYFADDINRLEKMLGRDLSAWRAG